jgi:2-iminobutanoate/2-iminopropanoate deaminase
MSSCCTAKNDKYPPTEPLAWLRQMSKKILFTEKAPKPVGPYSQAIVSDGFIFVSGQIAIDPETSKIVEGDIEVQTAQVLENIKNILESVSLSLKDVVKTTVFLRDINDFQVFNKVYSKYFQTVPPARTTVQANLIDGFLIEIDVIAKNHRKRVKEK